MTFYMRKWTLVTQNIELMENQRDNWEKMHQLDQDRNRKLLVKLESKIDSQWIKIAKLEFKFEITKDKLANFNQSLKDIQDCLPALLVSNSRFDIQSIFIPKNLYKLLK